MNEDLREVEETLEQVREAIDTARPVPLSSSVMINREELLAQLDDVLDMLPDEFRKARWVVKEREQVLLRARRDAEEIVAAAREESRRLVDQQEVVRRAAKSAQQLLEEAKQAAREKVLQAEDYIDNRLSQFGESLHQVLETIDVARGKLARGTNTNDDDGYGGRGRDEVELVSTATTQEATYRPGFFDQDNV